MSPLSPVHLREETRIAKCVSRKWTGERARERGKAIWALARARLSATSASSLAFLEGGHKDDVILVSPSPYPSPPSICGETDTRPGSPRANGRGRGDSTCRLSLRRESGTARWP